jgi:hypothetical protein
VESSNEADGEGILWFGLYLLLILFPFIVQWLRHSPGVEGRAFSLQFSAACGYVAFSVMAFEFALISRVGFVSAAFGQDSLLKFHRQMGLVAALLVALHVIFILGNGYSAVSLVRPADGPLRRRLSFQPLHRGQHGDFLGSRFNRFCNGKCGEYKAAMVGEPQSTRSANAIYSFHWISDQSGRSADETRCRSYRRWRN